MTFYKHTSPREIHKKNFFATLTIFSRPNKNYDIHVKLAAAKEVGDVEFNVVKFLMGMLNRRRCRETQVS